MLRIIPYTLHERNMFQRMSEMQNSIWSNAKSPVFTFQCDITDKGENYLLEAELPGIAKEDIGIDLSGEILTITAKHNTEENEKDEQGNYIRRERRIGQFSRSFNISEINPEGISASYNNGILSLTLPKIHAELPANRKIEIEG